MDTRARSSASAGGTSARSDGAARDHGEATALLLVAALATGVILASDVFESGAVVDRLLFGTLLGLDTADVVLSAAVAVLAVAGALTLGRTWAAVGFDPDGARSLGLSTARADLLLLALVAVAAVAAIPAVGALLVTAIYVLPAAAARMLAGSIRGLVVCALALALAEGVAGLYLAYWLDVPAGSARGRARGGSCLPRGRGRNAAQAASMSEAAVTVEQLAAGYGGVPVLDARLARGAPGPVGLRAGPERRREDDAVPGAARRARARQRAGGAQRSSRIHGADRAHAARLPGDRARRGADGHARRGPLVAAAAPQRT